MVDKTRPCEKLVDYIKSNPYKGLTISHTDIEAIIGIPYRKGCNCLNGKYLYHVSKANEKLTTFSLRLEAIPGFGYRIINDNEYINSIRKAYNTSVKYIEKAKFIADNTDTSSLNAKEKAMFNDMYNKVIKINKSFAIIHIQKNNKTTP